MNFTLVMLGFGIFFVVANLCCIPINIKWQKYGWATTHAIVAVIALFGLMSTWNTYKEYEQELSQIESPRQMVRMIVTASSVDPATGKRSSEIWINSPESLYVCAQMLAYSSYEDERGETKNFIDISCFNWKTGEQIEYLTKENLFPKGSKSKYGPELKKFLNLHGKEI